MDIIEIKLKIPKVKSKAGKLDVFAPFDNKLIASIEAADLNAVETALTNAYQLHKNKSKWLPLSKRIEILKQTVVLMTEQADELALLAAREGGKPLIDSKIEVTRAIDSIQICIDTIRTQAGKEVPMNLNSGSTNRFAFRSHEPIGVVAAISAFNHPLNLITHQVGPAVAVGCPVIVKPAEDTPLSCFRFVEILREAGLPDEYCQPLVVKEISVASKLASDARISFLTFIGSSKIGWMLRSKLAPGTRVALEHGGAAPVIVTENADLDETIPLLVKGGFYHAGQVCVSVQRVFTDEAIVQEVADRIVEKAKKLKIGDPTLPDTDVGPLIRHRETDRIANWVDEAVKEGAILLTGGNKVSDSCYECTVLLNPSQKSKVSQLEIFGPVVCIYSYSDISKTIEQANALPSAFQASIFTKDIDLALKAYKQLDASAVMINDHTAFRVDWMPFAGLKESGLAVGGIPYTIHDMQIEKMAVIRSKEL